MIAERLTEGTQKIDVRPTLVVGLGGTGVLIAQWTYHLLVQLLGAVPPFIKFVAFDTDAQEEGGPRDKLPEADFFNLFNTPHMQLGEVVRDYERFPLLHAHLDWLDGMKLDAAFVSRGCQGLSRLGRVVFFELLDSVIRREVVARFEALNGTNLEQQTAQFEPKGQFALGVGAAPVVHIVGSVCGGTGSGLLLDLAYNLRWWANEVFHRPADVVAHLVLPEAFAIDAPRILDKLRAVACATLEQIELLMDGGRKAFAVRYRNGVLRQFEKLTAPFDFCYLLSGSGPTGGDHRRHLVEMIGRVIRAMTVEPASKVIYADANNKQLDILSHVETFNQRRLCFASYGLRYGTPGHAGGPRLARHWVFQSLAGPGAAADPVPAEWPPQVERAVAQACDLDELARRLPAPERFEWQRPDSGADLGRSVRTALDAYCQNQEPRLQAEAAKVLPPQAPQDVVQVAAEMARAALKTAAGPGRVLGCLTLWHQQVRATREKLRAAPGPHKESLKQRLKQRAFKAVEERAREAGTSVDLLTAADVNEAVNRVVDEDHAELAKAYLREQRAPALERTEEHFEERLRALQNLSRLAQQQERKVGANGEADRNGNGPFAMPLFELVHPAEARDAAVAERFHQQLVVPVLEPFVRDGSGDLEKTEEGLHAVLEKLNPRLAQFVQQYQASQTQHFHQPLGKLQPSQHPLFAEVCKVVDGAGAKIAINQTRRFAETLDTVVGQHCEGTCIPGLLGSRVGGSYREALVAPPFEEQTRTWVQVIQLRYGFCLEALDPYEEYQAAMRRYLERAQFKPADLWLSPEWYAEYRRLREGRQQAAQAGRNGRAGAHDPEGMKQDLLKQHRRFYDEADGAIQATTFADHKSIKGCYGLLSRSRDEALGGLAQTSLASRPDAQRLAELAFRLAERFTGEAEKQYPEYGPRLRPHLEELRRTYQDWLRDHGFTAPEPPATAG
jgi:hypothetical protein